MRFEREQIAQEEALEAMTRTAALEARRRQREREQEEALALEMERAKREDESRRREIQRICAEDPSLRELQGKLKQAYINVERGEQVKEKVVLTAAQREAEERAFQALLAAQAEGARAEQRRADEARAKAEARKRAIEAQLEEKNLKVFLEAEQEAARERNMVQAILAKLAAEDEVEAAAKAKAAAETARVIEEF